MTTFEDIELSPDAGDPFELYLFIFGEGENGYYAYTNATKPVIATIPDYVNPVVFLPAPIKRETYKSSGKADSGNMSIRLPVSAKLANLFLDFPPTQPIGCVIRAGHYGQDDGFYPVIWVGRILSSARERAEAVLTCSSSLTSMKRVGLRRNYQLACPYVLYGTQCAASRANASYTAGVVAVSRSSLVLTPGWYGGLDPAKFEGGILKWENPDLGDEYRAINKVVAGGVGFVGPIRGVVVGQQVTLILGCNHKTDDCSNLHGNIHNYGGQPWIPLKNPVKQHSFW